jgi:hypothetical protein
VATLQEAAAKANGCKRPEGPFGTGHASITFGRNGNVSLVVLDAGPFKGSAVGSCIEGLFRDARVPPFDDPPGGARVGKSFFVE